MIVLVTGGSGFIGSHVVDRLHARGHEPRIFDLVRSKYHPDGQIETILGDLLDVEAVNAALAECDAVVHLAAVSDVAQVEAGPMHAELVNVRGTKIVLDAARTQQIARVVYASTIWVYGDANGSQPFDEDALLPLPRHLYTATKLAGEMYCHAYAQLYGQGVTILRFGIPYGPRSRGSAVIASFVDRALAGEPLSIAGDGGQSRQFLYVEDLAEGVVAALAEESAGRIYNLVGAESVSINSLAHCVQELVREVPIVHDAVRVGDLRSTNVSGARAARELGWRATTSIEEGIRRYVGWVTATAGTPSAETASRIDGNAATVERQEPDEL